MILLALSLTTLLLAQSENQSRSEFIEFSKRIDDRAGELTESEISVIEQAIERQEQSVGLKAYVLIMNDIPGWDFDEFARDQFNYWKSKGVLNDKSYLFIISISGKKFQIVRGKYIADRETGYDIKLLRDHLTAEFNQGNYSQGIHGYINGLSEVPSLKKSITEEKNNKQKSTWFTLIGILILIMVFMRMGLQQRRRVKEMEDEKSRSDFFVE